LARTKHIAKHIEILVPDSRLEKLQRLAEKVHQEAKVTDSKLDDIEAWIEDEAKRVDHLHPKDAKNNCDQVAFLKPLK
jgi:hypothetical protein